MLFRKLIAAMRAPAQTHQKAEVEYPLETEEKLSRLHARAAIRAHLEILHGDMRVGSESYVDLHFRCLEQTGTVLTPFTIFPRFQSRKDLLRYFLATLDVPGARVECGTYRGATALLLCHAWRAERADFEGTGFHLVDSFSGTSTSTERDLIPVRDPGGEARMTTFFPPGRTDVTADMVRGFFRGFPGARICAGWIPGVFGELPETSWAFVHLDLTLYEATLAALQYFFPKLSPGGVLVCVGSVFCPGVQAAVDEFSATHDTPYIVLGYGERVFLKN